MVTNVPNLADALTEAAKRISLHDSVEDTLDAIVATVVTALPEFSHAGISIMHKDGKIETLSGTDQLVWELDDLQYTLNEGPCVDAIRKASVVIVEHARHDQRWPRYMPQAAQQGLRAQLAVRLYDETETIGGLNLYSTDAETVDPESLHMAELFATHAALALGRARKEDQLQQAVASRKVIGQAIGIISERYQIDGDRAFKFLVRASQTSNIKLRLIAQEVVDTTDHKYAIAAPTVKQNGVGAS